MEITLSTLFLEKNILANTANELVSLQTKAYIKFV